MKIDSNSMSGYTENQFADFERESQTRIPEIMSRYEIDEDQAEKQFFDEIARR